MFEIEKLERKLSRVASSQTVLLCSKHLSIMLTIVVLHMLHTLHKLSRKWSRPQRRRILDFGAAGNS